MFNLVGDSSEEKRVFGYQLACSMLSQSPAQEIALGDD